MSVKDVINSSICESPGGETALTTKAIVLILFIACLTGVYIFLVYSLPGKTTCHSRELNMTIAGIPAIVATIIIAMQSNLLIFLGMIGALSIIRFQNTLKNPLDLLYLFWAITAGILIAVKLFTPALALSLIMTILLFLGDKFH